VYPNPSGGVINVDNANGYDRYEISNTYGVVVSSSDINSSNFKVDLSGFKGGFYYIVFISNGNNSKRKLVLE
jgi:hypothetical protein